MRRLCEDARDLHGEIRGPRRLHFIRERLLPQRGRAGRGDQTRAALCRALLRRELRQIQLLELGVSLIASPRPYCR